MIIQEEGNTLPEELADIARRIARDSTELEDIIRSWLSEPERTVNLGTGFDDDERHTLLWLSLGIEGDRAIEMFLPLSNIQALYPGMQPMTNFISLRSEDQMPCIDVDEDKLNSYLKISPEDFYNEALAYPLLDIRSAMPLILAYATANLGEVSISRHPADFDDIDWEAAGCRNAPFVSLSYQSPDIVQGMKPGFSESIYLDLES